MYVQRQGIIRVINKQTQAQESESQLLMSHADALTTNDCSDVSHSVPEDHPPPFVTATDLPVYYSRSMVEGERVSLLPFSSAAGS